MNSVTVISMSVASAALDTVLKFVMDLVKVRRGGYVCVSNVHMCMEAFDSFEFRMIVNDADLVIADGKPISWAQNLLGESTAQQVRGQDIMSALCSVSGRNGLNIGFYGGKTKVLLDRVEGVLSSIYPDINISYTYSPPFRPLTHSEDAEVVAAINSAAVDILFVGIGCPKQERWMAAHKDQLSCVMLGVGAAFDFVVSEKRHAPVWLQKIGMEWFFRLCSEPKRLWRRYLTTNPRFLWYFLQQWLFGRKF